MALEIGYLSLQYQHIMHVPSVTGGDYECPDPDPFPIPADQEDIKEQMRTQAAKLKPLIESFACMRHLFGHFLWLLHSEAKAIMNESPVLEVKDATLKAFRRAGGHVLKDAKEIARILIEAHDPLGNYESIGHWGYPDEIDDMDMISEDRWTAVKAEISQRWPYFAQFIEDVDDQKEQERYRLVDYKATASRWNGIGAFELEQHAIGHWISIVLTKTGT